MTSARHINLTKHESFVVVFIDLPKAKRVIGTIELNRLASQAEKKLRMMDGDTSCLQMRVTRGKFSAWCKQKSKSDDANIYSD